MEATQTQRERFESFTGWALHAPVLAGAQEVVAAAGLLAADLGSTWGVTVMSDRLTSLRVNLGGRELLSFDRSGSGHLLLLGVPPALLPAGVDQHPGFPSLPGSWAAFGARPDRLAALLRNPELQSQLSDYVRVTSRRLPSSAWNNPMVGSLLVADAP